MPILCETFEIARELVTICELDILPCVVPTLPLKLSKKIEKRLRKMGVEVRLNTGVTASGRIFSSFKWVKRRPATAWAP